MYSGLDLKKYKHDFYDGMIKLREPVYTLIDNECVFISSILEESTMSIVGDEFVLNHNLIYYSFRDKGYKSCHVHIFQFLGTAPFNPENCLIFE